MSYSDYNQRALSSWDRREQPEAPEPPEEAYCTVCEGEGGHHGAGGFVTSICKACNGTGLDPAKVAEYQAAAKEEADAEYVAYLESQQYEKDLDDYRKEEGE